MATTEIQYRNTYRLHYNVRDQVRKNTRALTTIGEFYSRSHPPSLGATLGSKGTTHLSRILPGICLLHIVVPSHLSAGALHSKWLPSFRSSLRCRANASGRVNSLLHPGHLYARVACSSEYRRWRLSSASRRNVAAQPSSPQRRLPCDSRCFGRRAIFCDIASGKHDNERARRMHLSGRPCSLRACILFAPAFLPARLGLRLWN